MNEHLDELVEAYLAGGLSAQERAAFAGHVDQCARCAALLTQRRAAEGRVMAMFDEVRAGAGFEEKMADNLMEKLMRTSKLPKTMKRWGAGAAAMLLLGTTGALANHLVSRDLLPRDVAAGGTPWRSLETTRPKLSALTHDLAEVNLGSEMSTTKLKEASKAIDAMKAQLSTASSGGQDEATAAAQQSQVRDSQVSRLVNEAKDAYDLQRYDQAKAVLEQARNIDPHDDVVAHKLAQADDKLNWQDWEKVHGARSAEMMNLRVNNYEAVIPYNDLMIYPDNWPELSRTGLKGDIGNGLLAKTDAEKQLGTQAQKNVGTDFASLRSAAANGILKAKVVYADGKDVFPPDQETKITPNAVGPGVLKSDVIGSITPGASMLDGNGAAVVTALPVLENGPALDAAFQNRVSYDVRDLVVPPPTVNSVGIGATAEAPGQAAPDAVPQSKSSNDQRATFGWSFNGTQIAQGSGAGATPTPDMPATAPGGTTATPPPMTPPALGDLKIIRHGSISLKVKSFLDASAAVGKAVAAQEGYIASSTSNELPNGKMQGTITLRVKPDRVDAIIAALRAIGEVKSQQIVAEDVGKDYTDTESELRALTAMEQRMLDLIQTGKGEVKDLVAAEQQLGEYRVRIEKLKGQLNFFNNQIGMATLTVDLTEKDIKAAASVTETETIAASIESEEVEAGYAKIRKAIEDAKGRIVSGQLQTQAQDRVVAQIVADIPPDQEEAVTAVLRGTGTVTQFEKNKAQTAPGGEDQTAGAAVERKDTRLVINMYNLAAIAPKETYVLTLAVPDVAAAFKAIQAQVKALAPAAAVPGAGPTPGLNRVLLANLQGQRPEQMTADVNAEVRASDAAGTLATIGRMGEIMISSTSMGPANATAAKSGFAIHLVAIQAVAARQNTNVSGIVDKVPDAAAKVQAAVAALTNPATRMIQAQVNQQDSRNISANLDFEVNKNDVMAVEKAIADAGIDVVARSNSKSTDLNNTLDSKVHYLLSISSADMLPPRRSTAVVLETPDVAGELAKVRAAAGDVHALETGLSTTSDGARSAAHVQFDVPADKADAILHAIDQIHGQKKSDDQSENRQVDTRYTRERIDLTLTTPALLVPAENGLGTSFKNGFFGGLTNLLRAMQFVIMGLVVALPFLLVLWVAMKLFKRKGAVK